MKLKYLTIIILTFFLSLGVVNAKEIMPLNEINPIDLNETVLLVGETTTTTEATTSQNPNYCTGLRSTFVFIGHLIRLAKILIPIIVIIFGTLDFFKAVTGAKDDEIKKAFKAIMVRIAAGVLIFLLPGLVQFFFNMLNEWSNYKVDVCCCTECLLNSSCDTNSCNSGSCKIEGMNN